MSVAGVLGLFRASPQQPPGADGRMALVDHLRELRARLLRVVLVLIVGVVVALFFYDQLLSFVYDPYPNTWTRMRPNREPPPRSGGNLAYDAARKLHILFGTQFGNDPHTWGYDLAKNEWRDLRDQVHRGSIRDRVGGGDVEHVEAKAVAFDRLTAAGGGVAHIDIGPQVRRVGGQARLERLSYLTGASGIWAERVAVVATRGNDDDIGSDCKFQH